MAYTIHLEHRAERDLRRLPEDVIRRIDAMFGQWPRIHAQMALKDFRGRQILVGACVSGIIASSIKLRDAALKSIE